MSNPIYLSLGAGVQSSTLALMAAHGEVGPIDGAIFSDTGHEAASTYEWLDWLEGKLPYPVYRVSKGDLAADATRRRVSKTGRDYVREMVPVYIKGKNEREMMLWRRCSSEYKLKPIIKELRSLVNPPRKKGDAPLVTSWVGISLDEVGRMKPSRDWWIVNEWPLIDLRMTREDCFRWMEQHGYPRPPRSACVFCPYHSNAEWRHMRDNEPAEFAKAEAWERKLQQASEIDDRWRSEPFLHQTLVQLGDANLDDDQEGQLHLFENECEGICGV